MSDPSPKPPQPPEMERRFMLYPYQMIGIPLLILLPVLAIFGVFGETSDTVSAGTTLHLNVEYPTRAHYQAYHTLTITVTNSSAETVADVTVGVESDYLADFNSISSSPNVDRITENAYEIDLGDLAPGHSRAVEFSLTAGGYGNHHGAVIASIAGEDVTRVMLNTLIFP